MSDSVRPHGQQPSRQEYWSGLPLPSPISYVHICIYKFIIYIYPFMSICFNMYMHVCAATAKSLQLCTTLCDPIDGSHQTPPSLGFSRQEHWNGLPFPSPMSESESEVAQWHLTLSYPMDYSLPGSSIHGIFQARVLEWVAIAFSYACVYTYVFNQIIISMHVCVMYVSTYITVVVFS